MRIKNNMKLIRMLSLSVIFVSTTIIITSCSASGPLFSKVTPEKNLALLYIYRPDAFCGVLASFTFLLDGEEAAILSNNGYTYFNLIPGEHKIMFQLNLGKSIEIILTAEAGESYYVTGFCGLGKSYIPFSTAIGYVLTAVPEEEALQGIAETEYQEPVIK